MKLPYAYLPEDMRVPRGSLAHVLPQMREGALLVVKRFGLDLQAKREAANPEALVRRARVGGFTVTYSCGAPGTLPLTSRTTWRTPRGSMWDPHQHVIEIDAGSRVLSFGWRGNGPIRSGDCEWGAWMSEFLAAADVPLEPQPKEKQMVAHPMFPSPWRAGERVDFAASDRVLAAPLTYTVVGYERAITRCVEPGTGFKALCRLILQDHRSSREADGMLRRERGRTTGFQLRAWAGRRRFRGEQPKALPDLRYWIAAESIELAADLLILFSHEAVATSGPSFGLAA